MAMKSHVRAAVIGGGVVGCSVLYHLTRLGWRDVVLIERAELTSGSTWHAAGGFHTINADPNMAALQGYTIRLYRELEEITGQSCGLHHVGGLTIADTPERMDFLRAERAKHRHMGLETEIVGPEEIAKISPILNTKGLLGALYDPLDGHLDPSGTTHAFARAARIAGAEIYPGNRVVDLDQRADGMWNVVTEQGTVLAEHVVNAAGLWAREVGMMAGVYLPLHPLEHQYLVTDDIPEVCGRDGELPHVVDPAGESYLRQEGRGLVLGIYEQDCEHWAVDGTPWDFGHELLPDRLERISGKLDIAFGRYPVLASAGIKRVINGPFTFAGDGNPLVGRVPGLKGFWACCGVMAGFSQGGGVGLSLAEWMVEGEPSRDIFAMDVTRFGDHCTPALTRALTRQNYQRRFAIAYPNEELPAGRPFHTTPAYGVWKRRGAVFGSGFSMEHVNYFAPEGEPGWETPSFRRSNAFAPVGEECRAVREAVGMNEVHNFSKFLIEGPEAELWLGRVMAGRLPREGRLTLSAHAQRARQAGGRLHDREDRARELPGQCELRRAGLPHAAVPRPAAGKGGLGHQCLAPAHRLPGRRSEGARTAGAHVTREDVSCEAMPFRAVRRMAVGLIEALVQRVSFTGDLGYEIYVAPHEQLALYETLSEAGNGLGPASLRHARHDEPAAGEVVRLVAARVQARLHAGRDRARSLHRLHEERLCRTRRRLACRRAGTDTAALHLRRRCRRRRCRRRRADLEGRRGGRVRDVGRLCALCRQVGRAGFRSGEHDRRGRDVRDRDPGRAAQGGACHKAAVRSPGQPHAHVADGHPGARPACATPFS